MIGLSFSWELTSYVVYVKIEIVEFLAGRHDPDDSRFVHTTPLEVDVDIQGVDLTKAMLCAALQVLTIWANRERA